MLDDGRVLVASDSAWTYGDGFRTLSPQGKWWDYRKQGCVIAYCGGGLHLSRLQARIDALIEHWKKEGLGSGLLEPLHLRDIIHDLQDELKTNDGIDGLDLELLYKGAPDGLFIIGGDGLIQGPYLDFAVIGSGAERTEGILTYALKPRRCPKRTKSAVLNRVLEAMRITADRRDGVSRPLWHEVFAF